MVKIRELLITLALMVVTGLLAACGGDSGQAVPTRFVPPSTTSTQAAPTSDTPISGAPISGAPTLPPTWTHTPTSTPSSTRTPSPTITMTPSLTITDTPTRTFTPTPSETPEMNSLMQLALLAAQATVLPAQPVSTAPLIAPPSPPPLGVTPTLAPGLATPLPATQCQYLPAGGFATIFVNEPNLVTQIGCPSGAPPLIAAMNGASQVFQGGRMLWMNEVPPVIYVFYSDGTFNQFEDTFDPFVDPESGGETPPEGLLEPVRGFGKVWRSFDLVHSMLAWAMAVETAESLVSQDFTQGRMIYAPSRQEIIIIIHQGTPTQGLWRVVSGSF